MTNNDDHEEADWPFGDAYAAGVAALQGYQTEPGGDLAMTANRATARVLMGAFLNGVTVIDVDTLKAVLPLIEGKDADLEDLVSRAIARVTARRDALDALAAMTGLQAAADGTGSVAATHRCGNCDGIDPETCLFSLPVQKRTHE